MATGLRGRAMADTEEVLSQEFHCTCGVGLRDIKYLWRASVLCFQAFQDRQGSSDGETGSEDLVTSTETLKRKCTEKSPAAASMTYHLSQAT